MTNVFDSCYTPPKGARYRVRNVQTGLYLLAPIDGWGKTAPQWTRIPECAARFRESQAHEQVNFLGWHPHRIRAQVTQSLHMAEGDNDETGQV